MTGRKMESRTKTILAVIAILVNIIGVVGGGLYTYFTIQGDIKESLTNFGAQFKSLSEKVTSNAVKIDKLSESNLLLDEDFEKKLRQQAPWLHDREKVLYRIEQLESSQRKVFESLEIINKNQTAILTKLDLVLEKR